MADRSTVINPPLTPPSERLLSLDALRGFDMFWIIGAEEIVAGLRKISDSGTVGLISRQLTHVAWAGFRFEDLIFPLFVFIVGVSLVFSLGKSVARDGKKATYWKIFRRTLLLYGIGVVYYGGISGDVERIRLLGVLQRIALCYCFASLLCINFRLRGLIVSCVGLLVGYWALMTFVPVPEVGAGNFSEGKNLANYIDRMYLPCFKWDGDHDPEGLLSTLPAISTCLLGVFAGMLLSSNKFSSYKKVFFLLLAGILGIGLGYLWGIQFPIIKKLWTSSFVLVAGGYSCLLLAVFYLVIDIWKLQRWATPFVWIGVNPITLYLAWEFVPFSSLAKRIVGGPIQAGLGDFGDLGVGIVAMLFVLLLARFLYKRKIFIRV